MDFSCFLKALKDDFLDLDSWYKQYLLASLIDYATVNKLAIKDFIFLNADYLYKISAIQHTINEILGRYFTKTMQN